MDPAIASNDLRSLHSAPSGRPFRTHILVSLLVFPLLSGCDVLSTHVVGDLDPSFDPNPLLGVWAGADSGNARDTLEFGGSKLTSAIRIRERGRNDSGLDFILTRSDTLRFFNIPVSEEGGAVPYHVWGRFDRSGDTISMSYPDLDKFWFAVSRRKLKGKDMTKRDPNRKRSQKPDAILLTGSSKEIAEFVRKHGEIVLFTQKVKYVRVR